MGRENELLGMACDAFARHDWAAALESFQAARKAGGIAEGKPVVGRQIDGLLPGIERSLDPPSHQRIIATSRPGSRDVRRLAAMFVAAHSMERGDTGCRVRLDEPNAASAA